METRTLTPRKFYGTPLPGIGAEALRGRLIVLEGADGSGRSTQIGSLRGWLEHGGQATVEVGLKRSEWIGAELDRIQQGNILNPLTLSLFYATDFAEQLEHKILPALRSGFVVLADRYIYTLMARAIVRGVDPGWIQDVYDIALVPDAVFYLRVSPERLAERNFRKNHTLDYWESGMDIRRSGDMYASFLRYQRRMQRAFRQLQATYGFEIVDGNRSPFKIAQKLKDAVERLLT